MNGEYISIDTAKKIEEQRQEIERLKSQLDFIEEQNKYIDKLEKLLQQKENIIKEVREVVEEKCREEYGGFSWYIKNILDKGNDEVEIIEEDEKIEKLDIYNCFHIMGDNEISRLRLDDNFQNISDKINEIIDYINKGENK